MRRDERDRQGQHVLLYGLFDGDLSKWDVSRVTDIDNMLSYEELFNGGLTKWDVSSVIDMDHMLYRANFLTATSQSGTCRA